MKISPNILRAALACAALLLILAGVFALGVRVGERKARHFSRWENRSGRASRQTTRGFPSAFNRAFTPFSSFPDTHTAFGKIISASGTELLIQSANDVEKDVLVTSSTIIRIGRETGTAADLQPNTNVSVFGAPNDQGQIEARLIRILSPRP